LLGSLHLKKMPPMPVTFFISWVTSFCPVVVSMVLNAKPERNDAAMTRVIKVVFFILYKCLLFWYAVRRYFFRPSYTICHTHFAISKVFSCHTKGDTFLDLYYLRTQLRWQYFRY
jgi:hypothetical protein